VDILITQYLVSSMDTRLPWSLVSGHKNGPNPYSTVHGISLLFSFIHSALWSSFKVNQDKIREKLRLGAGRKPIFRYLSSYVPARVQHEDSGERCWVIGGDRWRELVSGAPWLDVSPNATVEADISLQILGIYLLFVAYEGGVPRVRKKASGNPRIGITSKSHPDPNRAE
jgi:hypothetical protein